MNSYEGMFVIDPELKESELEKVTSNLEEAIAKSAGVVENREKWGKRRLAYKVNKRREGYYYLVHFKAEPDAISKLYKTYKLNDSVLRTLIIRK